MGESTWESMSPDDQAASGRDYGRAEALRDLLDENDDIDRWLDDMAEAFEERA